jgi:predicted metallo-beta-lactamase superfamily hydrolase
MQVIPLCADSMGVRSMATYVEAGSVRLLIDPGAVLADHRYGLGPHPLERWTFDKMKERILLFAKASNAIAVTRWDPEHCFQDQMELFRGKRLMLKNPNLHMPMGPRKAAFDFIKTVRRTAADISYADGRTFTFGPTRLAFCDSVAPRPDMGAGGSLALAVLEEEDRFGFSSSTRGAVSESAAEFFCLHRPGLLYLDGPLTHAADPTRRAPPLPQLWKRIRKLIADAGTPHVVMDHHLLRDANWRIRMEPLAHFCRENGVHLETAAEYRGEEVLALEAGRRRLYERDAAP